MTNTYNTSKRFHRKQTPPRWKSRVNRLFLITAVFALFFVLCTVPVAAHTDHDHLEWTGVTSLDDIISDGNYYLENNIELTDTWTVLENQNITLCLNGKVINQTDPTKTVIQINSGAQLNLYDCGNDKHYFDKKSDGLWVWNDENTGSLYNVTGGVITGGNSADNGGGGVDNDGTFIMVGGNIIGNTAGGGGGVANADTFTMSGGSITGNTANFGGGVENAGTFTMSGGNIVGNTAMDGGGVYNYYTFTMSGGNIVGNTAEWGGGVVNDYGTFTMTGGSITGNTAVNSSGGGVCNSGTFTMSGGNIVGNTAECGGGVVIESGTFTMSGNPKISGNTKTTGEANNVYIDCTYDNIIINIASEGLTSGASVGVTGYTAPTEANPVIVTNTTVAESNLQYFFADKSDEHVEYDAENQMIVLAAGAPPVPTPTPSGNGDLNITYNNSQRYTVVIPGDMDFAGRLTINNDARVIEMWLEINSVLNVSVKSANGFEMTQGESRESYIPYEMSVDGGEPLEGTEFNVIMSVPADTPKDIDLGYFVKKDLWYEVSQAAVDAAKFAGEHKDTLTFKVEVENASV